MIIVNFKNYKIGSDVIDLIKKIEIYYNKAIVAVPSLEIKEAVGSTRLEVYAQHVDYHEKGKGTGKVIPEDLITAGVKGSILNHSEHKLKFDEIKQTVKRCNEMNFKLVICASNLTEVKKIAKLRPYAIAFEDPKLISTGNSITEYKSVDVKKFVGLLDGTDIIPLCGAGITKGEDVAAALVLGCRGILVSSAVANSQNPEGFLKEIGGLI